MGSWQSMLNYPINWFTFKRVPVSHVHGKMKKDKYLWYIRNRIFRHTVDSYFIVHKMHTSTLYNMKIIVKESSYCSMIIIMIPSVENAGAQSHPWRVSGGGQLLVLTFPWSYYVFKPINQQTSPKVSHALQGKPLACVPSLISSRSPAVPWAGPGCIDVVFCISPFPMGTVQVLRNRHELCPLLLALPTCLVGTFL